MKYGIEKKSSKSIASRDLVKASMDLLREGSEGSQICDDVEKEINGLIKAKSIDEYTKFDN